MFCLFSFDSFTVNFYFYAVSTKSSTDSDSAWYTVDKYYACVSQETCCSRPKLLNLCQFCEIRSVAMKACIVPSLGMTIYQWNFQRSKQSRLSCHPRWRQRCLWSIYCKQQEDLPECSLLFIYHKILEINYHTAQGIIISDQKRCCWYVM